ncbi:hypothetical protein AJ80_07266 [Polytolypa hystricis UAMH7299]|uniref:protein-ribulosamine 3-kinase n=1 Tax=Polytolypa hystricis (strain UAMH7299) TaxID=1447883 RepID=A0A2B7XHF4_POLH7|nr:hypothetical protein AJ80_07266 [Polytolypa hystricis UAMH7299]
MVTQFKAQPTTMAARGRENLELSEESIKLDSSIIAEDTELPKGSKITAVLDHGTSFWAHTSRLDVELQDGTSQSFFIKVISNTIGKNMVHGEFESMKTIYELSPEFAAKPVAWGAYQEAPDTYFFLCEYRDMTGDIPAPDEFTSHLAAMHKNSKSPTSKFGFHMDTYCGNLPQMNEWEDSWETFFTKNLKLALKLEAAARGWDPEFDELVPVVFDKVVPRLLRPLESEGRSIKPSLVHGDLWFSNSGVDATTNGSLIFDACCLYAHNEYEFGQWRPVCNRFGPDYLAAYQSHCEKSPPEEDYDGRLDLYKLRFNTHVSALFPENETLREQMLGDMRDLVQRYGGN